MDVFDFHVRKIREVFFYLEDVLNICRVSLDLSMSGFVSRLIATFLTMEF